MPNFAEYALAGILRSAGWPKESGFFRRKVSVSSNALDLAVDQLLRIGIGLGVGRPQTAVSLIADSFDRDWTTDSVRKLMDLLDLNPQIVAEPTQPPWETIASPRFSEMQAKDIPWEWLGVPELATHYVGWFAQSLLWGILYPDEAGNALWTELTRLKNLAGSWEGSGLDMSADRWPSDLNAFFATCMQVVDSFETERRPLAEAPDALRAEPRIAERLRSIE